MIFFSHSWAQKRQARQLVESLCRAGLPVWFDEMQMKAGAKLGDELLAAVRDSSVYFYFCSPEALDSEWVRKELDEALRLERDKRIHVVPVLRVPEDRVALPTRLSERLYVVLDTNEGGGEARVAHAIRDLGAQLRWSQRASVAAIARLTPSSMEHTFDYLPRPMQAGTAISLLPLSSDYSRLDEAYWAVSNYEFPAFPDDPRERREPATRMVRSMHDAAGRIIAALPRLAAQFAQADPSIDGGYATAALQEILHGLLWSLSWRAELLGAYAGGRVDAQFAREMQGRSALPNPFAGPGCDFVTVDGECFKAQVPDYAAPDYPLLVETQGSITATDLGRAIGHTLALMFVANTRPTLSLPHPSGMKYGPS